jgi:hypothetical protein
MAFSARSRAAGLQKRWEIGAGRDAVDRVATFFTRKATALSMRVSPPAGRLHKHQRRGSAEFRNN